MPNDRVRLDLNNPTFQRQWFGLPKDDQLRVLRALRKLSELTWDQVYRDHGLKWELIYSKTGPNQQRLYSLRLAKGFRAVAYREGDWMRLLTLHPDHDSTYDD
ncbi:hypothetical protein IW967_02750 [Alicyclobacillus mali]|uniref:Uncharacterized protein n=1 Tax=Alicyclobacillus mali (ex Roth et al. 2021) TaxID=1123961 RepID=A0ABS0F0I6_9BACL|nr:hypothetical protein [Alicyclobacillus mali (ex Roth et al. 2021)]MBF8376792.1 hypothetical protein [Alicyclobacillus mali (ex Roth et al. 2021)]